MRVFSQRGHTKHRREWNTRTVPGLDPLVLQMVVFIYQVVNSCFTFVAMEDSEWNIAGAFEFNALNFRNFAWISSERRTKIVQETLKIMRIFFSTYIGVRSLREFRKNHRATTRCSAV